jgi:hypothetical protein
MEKKPGVKNYLEVKQLHFESSEINRNVNVVTINTGRIPGLQKFDRKAVGHVFFSLEICQRPGIRLTIAT